ncbi:MAG: hypothetical protein ACKVVT_02525 [Dehalococcoidia bacterium]
MQTPRIMLSFALAFGLLAWAAAACGDDDDDEPETPGPTTTTGASTTPSGPTPTQGANPPSVTVTVVPTPAGATSDSLARSPQYVLYEVGESETVSFIAAAMSATTGPTPAGFADQIKQINRLTDEKVAPGLTLAVPLRLAGTLSLIPEASVESAVGVGGKAGKLVLLQPSLKLREGFLGKLGLHRVALADGTPDREGFGYLTEYWLADRSVVKEGGIDPDARFSDPGFIVAAGTYAETLGSSRQGDLHRFERDGVPYAVKVLRGVTRTPAELAALLETAKDR